MVKLRSSSVPQPCRLVKGKMALDEVMKIKYENRCKELNVVLGTCKFIETSATL